MSTTSGQLSGVHQTTPMHPYMYVYVYEQWNIQETNVALRGLKLAAASSAGKNDRQTM
jgi:hypothetical protein